MDNETRAQFWFEPGCLRRHYVSGIGNVNQLIHGYWIQCESHCHFTAVDAAFEFSKSSDTTYEIYAFVATEIRYIEYVTQDQVAGYRYVKHTDRIFIIKCSRLGC